LYLIELITSRDGNQPSPWIDMIVFSYQYLLDPKVSSQFPSNSIVIFDEAHNIGSTKILYCYENKKYLEELKNDNGE